MKTIMKQLSISLFVISLSLPCVAADISGGHNDGNGTGGAQKYDRNLAPAQIIALDKQSGHNDGNGTGNDNFSQSRVLHLETLADHSPTGGHKDGDGKNT